jgi:uncharacterized protein
VTATEEAAWTRPEPPVTDVSAPFWEATRTGTYLLQWCTTCQLPVFFPRAVCPRCLTDTLEWRPASGRGTVYAVTVEHHAMDPRMADRVPFAVALIDLDEGVRVMSNVVNCAPEDVRVGQAVTMVWEPLPDGRQLALFEPVPH